MIRFVLSLLCTAALCLTLLPQSQASESSEQLIARGDAFDEKFEAAEALKCYLVVAKEEPDNVGLILRIARQYRHLMADAGPTAEKLKLANTGLAYALRAVALAPEDPETHLSVAISRVKMVPLLGSREKMEASKQIKVCVDKALSLAPDKDLAWHILGCWHQRLAEVGMVKRTIAMLVYDGGLPEASNESAVKCFEKAIKLNPGRLIHYIELGRTYAQMGKESEARRYIEKGLAMPSEGKDDPDAKMRGRETLMALR